MDDIDFDEPVGYLMLPKGTLVVTSDGVTVGTVAEVRYHEREQMLDGIVVDAPDGKRFVDAPEVGFMTRRKVDLEITAAAFQGLTHAAPSPGAAAGADAVEIFVATYATETGAAAALDAFHETHGGGTVDLIDTAVVVHGADGKVTIPEQPSKGEAKKWLKRGAIAGGVAGLIFPPSLIATAIVGGGVGGLWGSIRDKGFADGDLRRIGDDLPAGSSAVIAVARNPMLEQLERGLTGYETVSRQVISAEAAAAIAAAAKADQG